MVMSSLKSVSYKLIINGGIRGTVIPSRGIRQGDPISPELFILYSQALSSIISTLESSGLLRGIQVQNRTKQISHLLFADDCLLFSEMKLQEVCQLKLCLETYCKASGQAVNLSKSSLSFSPNTPLHFRRWFSRILKISYGKSPSKYLGLPTEFGLSKSSLFKDISEKTGKRLSGWKQTTPFLCWEFLQEKMGSNSSWAWRSILEGRKVLELGLIWHIGNGEQVSDLIDENNRRWKHDLLDLYFHPLDKEAILQIQLGLFSSNDYQLWGVSKNSIYSVKSPYHLLSNQWVEKEERNSSSTTLPQWKEIFSLVWKSIWSYSSLPKIKHFLWRACGDGIASGVTLHQWRVPIDRQCLRCGVAEETNEHILLYCPFAWAVWFGSIYPQRVPENVRLSGWISRWSSLFSMGKSAAKEAMSLASFICWHLWCSRNALLFSSKADSPNDVILSAHRACTDFLMASMPPPRSSDSPLPSSTSMVSTWTPPPLDSFKLNCDASWNPNKNQSGLGFLIRNHLGESQVAVSTPYMFNNIWLERKWLVEMDYLRLFQKEPIC
ncbi:uncharacterized protein LOC122650727 [Telopea speciosissima]|uniref:uncharacterized protein LOC122650727 n=1 Tax=Telopea speciosissima TaxID=54955 RepID=UPI001CC7ACC6|nr:uncharacterized protein LOC122650727 [Telopea speciosissima]